MSEEPKFYRPLVTNLPPAVLAKWPEDLLEEGFVPFPKKLLRGMPEIWGNSAAVSELAIILATIDFKRADHWELPSREYLAFLSGLKRPRFDSAYRRLKEKKFIKTKIKNERLDINLEGFFDAVREHVEEDNE